MKKMTIFAVIFIINYLIPQHFNLTFFIST